MPSFTTEILILSRQVSGVRDEVPAKNTFWPGNPYGSVSTEVYTECNFDILVFGVASVCQSVTSSDFVDPLNKGKGFQLYYENIYLMDWHRIVDRCSWFPDNVTSWLWWSPDFFPYATMTFIFLIEKSYHQLDGLAWNLVDTYTFPSGWVCSPFGDPLTFHLTTSSG